MISKCFKLLVLGAVLASTYAHADETYLCTFGQKSRIISIVYQNQESKLPCEVRYKKEGVSETLWHSKNQISYCEERAEDFIRKQVDWGWRCGNTTNSSVPVIVNPGVLSNSQIDTYKFKAHFAQAISIATPFKLQSTMYVSQMGAFPKRLEDIGYKREQMRTSKKISDLKIDGGAIKIKGNKELGKNTVIILTPKFSLGGTSIEWSCSTNVDLNDPQLCNFDQNATFN